MLLEKGVDIHAVKPNLAAHLPGGKTHLMAAAQEGFGTLVQLLLDYNAAPNIATTDTGETALMLASQCGNAEVVAALLAATGQDGEAVDLNVVDKDGDTALICSEQIYKSGQYWHTGSTLNIRIYFSRVSYSVVSPRVEQQQCIPFYLTFFP